MRECRLVMKQQSKCIFRKTEYKKNNEQTQFCWLFYVIGFSLCYLLTDGLFSWSRAVQIRTNLDLVLDWLQGAGLGDIASEFMKKLSVTVNFLCVPKTRLIQVRLIHEIYNIMKTKSCINPLFRRNQQIEIVHCVIKISHDQVDGFQRNIKNVQ